MTLKDGYRFGGFSGTPPLEPNLSAPPPPPPPGRASGLAQTNACRPEHAHKPAGRPILQYRPKEMPWGGGGGGHLRIIAV